MYKMFKFSAETFAKNCVQNIIDKKELWISNKDIGETLEVENIYDLVDKENKDKFKTNNTTKQRITEYKRHGSELFKGEKYKHTHQEIIIPIIMKYRVSTARAIEFRSKLGFKQNNIILY